MLSGTFSFGSHKIQVARAALQIDHDDVFGRAPTGAAGALAGLGRHGLQLEERAEREAEHAAPPMRSRSRRVIFRCGSQRSLQVPPVILIISFILEFASGVNG